MYGNLYQLLGDEMFYQGRRYPYYLIDYEDSKFVKPYYYNYIRVEDNYTDKEYQVMVKNNGEEIYEYHCDCNIFKINKMRKHVAAALVQCYYEIRENEYFDELMISSKILNSFKNTSNLRKVHKIKKKVNLDIELAFDTYPVSFRLLIGQEKCML